VPLVCVVAPVLPLVLKGEVCRVLPLGLEGVLLVVLKGMYCWWCSAARLQRRDRGVLGREEEPSEHKFRP